MMIELLNGELVDIGNEVTDAKVEALHAEKGLEAAYQKNIEAGRAYRAAYAAALAEQGATPTAAEAKALAATEALRAEVTRLAANPMPGTPEKAEA